MLNNITIMGRMVRDPELRYTQSQTPVCSFSLACERDRKDANGDKQTDFIDCTAWRNTAEFVHNYMAKGTLIVVSGRLQIQKFTDKDNNKRTSPEIVVDNVYFAESKRRDADERAPFPSDADAPPEVDRAGLAELAAQYPNNVQFADADGALPWE